MNPLPFQVGGGPTPKSRAYQVIRQAVGKGGSAENDRGIDGLWRRARAEGLAAATSAPRRAILQAFPFLATDLLPYYERVLGFVADPDESEATRRDRVVERWTEKPIQSWPELEDALQAIDARVTISMPADAVETVGQAGRVFDSHVAGLGGPWFALPGGCSELPNYSTRQTIRVRFTLGYTGVPKPSDQAIIERVKARLRAALPTDVDFALSTETFTLGQTPLGLGAIW